MCILHAFFRRINHSIGKCSQSRQRVARVRVTLLLRQPDTLPQHPPSHLLTSPPFSCLHIIHRLCLSQASHKFTAHTLIRPECNPRSEQYPALSTPVVLYALPGTFSYLYLRATVSSLSLSLLLLLLLATLLIDMPPLGSSNHR